MMTKVYKILLLIIKFYSFHENTDENILGNLYFVF